MNPLAAPPKLGTSPEELQQSIQQHIRYSLGKNMDSLSLHDWFIGRFFDSERSPSRSNVRHRK